MLDISSADGTRIPRSESNLVYRSAKGLFDKVGKKIPPLKIVQTNPIPMAGAWVPPRPASSRACWAQPDAGRCAQHPGAADAGHVH